MSNVKVISINYNYEQLLSFLFPEYTITDSQAVTSKFITHRQVKSKAERELLDVHYNDCIFISNQIFDELWDEKRLIEECINFSRRVFKNRKKTLTPSKENFIRDCIDFIISNPHLEDDAQVNELFDTYGSARFPIKFFQLCEVIPYQQLTASMLTFISKIRSDTTSAYYKKKAMLFESRINKNMDSAIEIYNSTPKDGYGLAECMLFVNLIR